MSSIRVVNGMVERILFREFDGGIRIKVLSLDDTHYGKKIENPAPFMAVHPGMMIKPELDERGISQKEFAKMLGIQSSHLSEVLNGKRALTTELALKIENAIGLPAKILLSAQTQYELESTVEDNQHETVAVTIPVRDRNLLQELVRKFGWACVF